MSYIGNQPVYQAFVTDQFSGNGSTTAFTMSVAPANTASVLVAVSGVLQDPSTYSVSGTTLTFSAAPPSGTGNISARYLGIPASGVTTTAYRTVTEFTATAGQTTFTPPSYTVGYINVYRNGVRLAAADYTASNGTTVVLASGATAGDTVTVESYYVSSVIGAIPATAGAVTDTYLNTGAVTQTKIATGVAGTGPAFSATMTANQSLSNATLTLVQFNSASSGVGIGFDTNNAYNTSAYKFTPQVAGYYQVTVNISGPNSSSGILSNYIFKNGSNIALLCIAPNISGGAEICGSCLVYMNGSTDYIQAYAYQTTGGSAFIYSGAGASYFQAALIRAA